MIGINVAIIAIISVLLFGSVEPWAFGIVGILTSVTLFYHAYRGRLSYIPNNFHSRILLFSFLLILYPLFQVFPVPITILKTIQPGFSDLLTIPPDLRPSLHGISIYPYATEMELIRLTVFIMLFLMTAYGIDSRQEIKRTIRIISLFGFFLGLFSIIQHATWNGRIYWFRELTQGGTPFGPFVNRNHFAGLMGMIVPLSLGLTFSERNREKKALQIFISVIMSLALFLSLSRGGIISFFGGLFIFSIVILTLKRGSSYRRLLPIFIFLAILVIYLLYLGITPIVERFYKTDVTSEQRLSAWQASLSIISDFPIFGSGMGTFQYIFKKYKPDGLYAYWDHAHNDYIEQLVEGGILGFILIAAFLFFVIRGLFRIDIKKNDLYLRAGIISSITAMMTHSFFDFNLHIPSNAIVFFMILGLAVAICRTRQDD